MKKMLNIGCGHRYHTDWVNIDVDPATPEVMKADIIKGLPFSENTFDVVYHSNVLEHLPSDLGQNMIAECFRVLKPGGILRISVPDLEKICREYLSNMEKASKGDNAAAHAYDWILIEMLDQVSRNKSGGTMAEYLSQPVIPNPGYLRARLGEYFDNWRNDIAKPRVKKSLGEKIRFILKHPGRLKRLWHAIVLSKKEREWLEIGRLRLGGEVHYHMYDRYSLERLLLEKGFHGVKVQTPVDSLIPGWTAYNLDYTSDGAGLFIEAIK
jgi:predicted SAM-dependent methyltransferase